MAADPYTDETSTQRFSRSAPASDRLREVNFPMVVRGYHRPTVDLFIAELLELVEDLESHQTREGVVQKALGELGEETAGILQRAHETADDIAARSRAQADARLQRAERESEILRRDADEYAEQVIVDTRALWDERQRLIEDIRQLADEVLGTADDAIERLKLPEALGTAEAEEQAAGFADDQTAALADDPETVALAADSEQEPFPDDPEPTEPFRLGAVADEPVDPPADSQPPEEHGHTVELEALPGGSEEPPHREQD